MTSLRARRIGNWTFTSYGHVFALTPDLTQGVMQPVPNRAERRRAGRDRAHDQYAVDSASAGGER